MSNSKNMIKEDNDRLKVKFKTKCYLERINGCFLEFIVEAWYTPEKGIYQIEKFQLKNSQVEHTPHGRRKSAMEIVESLQDCEGFDIETYYEKFGEERFLEDFKDLLSWEPSFLGDTKIFICDDDFVVQLLNSRINNTMANRFIYNKIGYTCYCGRIKVLKVENEREEVEHANPVVIDTLLDIMENTLLISTGVDEFDKYVCEKVILDALADVQYLTLISCITLQELSEECSGYSSANNLLWAIDRGLRKRRMRMCNE